MNFNRNDIEIHYCQSLLALKFIFEQTEVNYWAKWIEKDLDKWENEKSVHHHISAYGGMGSLSDLIIKWTWCDVRAGALDKFLNI